MSRKRVFISFDYDHDVDLKNALVGQSRLPDSPFTITDMSIKSASPEWKADARRRIKGCDVLIVICGQYTHTAIGVGVELKIAQEERISYFLLEIEQDLHQAHNRQENRRDVQVDLGQP